MEEREAIRILSSVSQYADRVYREALTLAISALKKQDQDRWHSVAKEGNPKESDGYLVSSNDKIVFVLYYSLEHGWDGWWNDRITAWRPLPKPYAEEEQKE